MQHFDVGHRECELHWHLRVRGGWNESRSGKQSMGACWKGSLTNFKFGMGDKMYHTVRNIGPTHRGDFRVVSADILLFSWRISSERGKGSGTRTPNSPVQFLAPGREQILRDVPSAWSLRI
jgi:hypothetical protein